MAPSQLPKSSCRSAARGRRRLSAARGLSLGVRRCVIRPLRSLPGRIFVSARRAAPVDTRPPSPARKPDPCRRSSRIPDHARAGDPSAGYAAAVLATMLLTLVGLHLICGEVAGLVRTALETERYGLLPQIAFVYGIILVLTFAIIIHCLADLGFYRRRASRAALPSGGGRAGLRRGGPRGLLVLVPSYKEQPGVIRQTLISAALVEYPGRRVVLLLDDPPAPTTGEDAALLGSARRLPGELQALLDVPADHLGRELAAYGERARAGAVAPDAEAVRLARLYDWAAGWLEALAAGFAAGGGAALSHTDRLFADRVLLAPARAHRAWAEELRRSVPDDGRIAREYRRLAALFRVELAELRAQALRQPVARAQQGDEPQQLSRARRRRLPRGGAAGRRPPRAVRSRRGDGAGPRRHLRRHAGRRQPGDLGLRAAARAGHGAAGRRADRDRADALHGGYPTRRRCSSGRPRASTDAQFFSHQGMAHFGASFWVGASALMRRAALEDIAIVREERGHPVRVYVDDRILIEDAAATVDLLGKGWRVHHDPRAALLQRHAGRLRRAPDPAPPLGERRPADPAAAAPAHLPPALVGAQARRAGPAAAEPDRGRRRRARVAGPAALPLRRQPGALVDAAGRRPVLPAVRGRPAPRRLPLVRPAAGLRAQHAADRGQPRRHAAVAAAGLDRPAGAVPAHAQGGGPHADPGRLPRRRSTGSAATPWSAPCSTAWPRAGPTCSTAS